MAAPSALNAMLSVKGQKQGDIRGSSTYRGREGKIVVLAAWHEMLSPRDAATGQATGRRLHRPFVVLKEVDASTPRLYSALVASEILTAWELQCWGTSETTGETVLNYVVKLTNANVANIRFVAGEGDGSGTSNAGKHTASWARTSALEEISFTYQRIEWTWAPTGSVCMDDWMASKGRKVQAASGKLAGTEKPGRSRAKLAAG